MRVLVPKNRIKMSLSEILSPQTSYFAREWRKDNAGEGELDYRFNVFLFIMGKRFFLWPSLFSSTSGDPDMYKS